MPDCLLLPDGRAVCLGPPTPGGSKNQTRFGTLPDGRRVVVKVEGAHGDLTREAIALNYLNARGIRVPRVICVGTAVDGEKFLVLGHESGARPSSTAGWWRLGRDLAALVRVGVDDWPASRAEPATFVRLHNRYLQAVTSLVDALTGCSIHSAIEHLALGSQYTLTHGDPGAGNYLDNGGVGVLLDWETAQVAPFGLDLGRAAFIALLDNDHTGLADQLHAAVVSGYRSGLPPAFALDARSLRSATIVAGLQFIHDRHAQPLRADRTASAAIGVLAAYLERSQ